ncbi:MAG: RNA-binding transcriptional accessory protein, partial [Candidatus Omnitrophica bacterium]|nr:RNA-binding transcriptional accessory protein [Candidatus Omnitrophota bacterium]
MNSAHIHQTAAELNLRERQVEAVAQLLEGGATVPFLARYRKEVTGSLDEVAITSIRDRMKELLELDKRRAVVLESIEKQGKLTPELKAKIEKAATLTELEDLYLPYKPKRRTRGMIAREKGLEPLAEAIFRQEVGFSPEKEALKYVDAEKELGTAALVLAGARDIIAEQVNENAEARAKIRELYLTKGTFSSKVVRGKEEAGSKFKDYFEWKEPVADAPSHRVLAVRRGEKENILILRILAP